MRTCQLKIINVALIMTESHYNILVKMILPTLLRRGQMWVQVNE